MLCRVFTCCRQYKQRYRKPYTVCSLSVMGLFSFVFEKRLYAFLYFYSVRSGNYWHFTVLRKNDKCNSLLWNKKKIVEEYNLSADTSREM